MSIDILQEKIRKMKNPTMVDFAVKEENIPPHILQEEGSAEKAYFRFCKELLEGLQGFTPAVRFSFSLFSMMENGLQTLSALLADAKKRGFYVVLEAPGIQTPWNADAIAKALGGQDSLYPCDALVISPYIGSDALKPFVPCCKEGKDVFVIVRSPNKTASELQDLLTGTRLVHNAAADMVSRFGEPILGKCGYSRFAALASAGSANSLRNLRSKYSRMFLLVDGLDYPSGNAKNCSLAFDKFGHGAVVCAGPSVTGAWRTEENDGTDYITCAQQAVERIKKNVTRYVTVL